MYTNHRLGRRRDNRRRAPLPLAAVGFLLVIVLIVGYVFALVGSRQSMTCLVTDKDRTTSFNGKSSSTDARIWTENCGVLSLNDSLLALSFSTADKYGQVKVGQTYKFETQGWRVPFFSMFPNITDVKEVTP